MVRAAVAWAWLAVAGLNVIHAADLPKAGDPAPEIMAYQPDGNGVPFPSELKGRIVLVVFWQLDAAGTGGLPFAPLRKLRAAHARDDRFLILTVCVTEADRSQEWAALIEGQREVDHAGHKVKFLDDPKWWNAFEVGRDPARLTSKRFGVSTFPAYYLIGTDGRLVATRVPEKDLGSVVGLAVARGPGRAGEQDEKDPGGHVAWVARCLKDMAAIKAGATREDVEERFQVARGYFRPNEAIYHYRACPLFQITVKYNPAPGKAGSNDSPGDTVAEVDGPYLSDTNADLERFGVR